MSADMNVWATLGYIVVFVFMAWRQHEWQWLSASVLLWLCLGLIGAQLMPYVWGVTHLSSFYTPYFYITVGSLFFFINHWHSVDHQGNKQATGSSFLALFAVTGLQSLLALLALLFCTYYLFNEGNRPYIVAALFQLYFTPLVWIGMQIFMILLFYLHRVMVMKQPATYFSRCQLYLGVLLFTAFQLAYMVSSINRISY